MNQWYKYFRQLAVKTKDYRLDKAIAARCYRELALGAPSRPARELLLKCAAEEQQHTVALGRLYQQLTGRPAPDLLLPTLRLSSYQEGLRQRVLAESAAFVRYGEEFLTAPDFPLRRLFYHLSAIAVQHGLFLTLCLNLEEPRG